MRKPLIFILVTCLFYSIDMYAQSAEKPKGNGSQNSPFEISNLDNLYWLASNPSSWGNHFKQTGPIDAAETAHWNNGEGWVPLGWEVPFTGVYDGGGFSISNLHLHKPNGYKEHVGFFAHTKNASIRNVRIQSANFTLESQANGFQSGLLIGLSQSSQIENCQATGFLEIGATRSSKLIGKTE